MQGQKSKKVSRVIALLALLLSWPYLAEAQQPAKIPRIGYLTGTREPTRDAPDANRDAFRQGLRDLGYVEGKNIRVEYRYGAVNPDRAAKQATTTIPIVMVTNQNPVVTRMVDSLAHPGGNITGVTRLTRELSGKRLELFNEMVPKISRVAVLWRTLQPPAIPIKTMRLGRAL